ncbi:MAG: single-stranded-DNA-specific exonuclease RecJ [Lachnospiraceae bacterium]|nr:single-stranded-DNA-specific exonuclease RecJ [Lachnospiraceae bacterium]
MPKELWFETKVPGDYRALSKEYGVSPMMARLINNRLKTKAGSEGRDPQKTGNQGLDRETVQDFLNADRTDQIFSYEKLPDIKKCTDILEKKIKEGARIRVIGDYDIDGVCSVFILTKGLKKLKAKVDCAIPHRILDGYGLNERLIREASNDGIDCIITCDNGISASKQIDLAHELGMTVIVTDHHEVPYHMVDDKKVEDIPKADAVVDIKRSDSQYGFTEICGAQVAFKVMLALYDRFGDSERKMILEFIEFGAFAAIGDIMPLINENRPWVKLGLKRLEHTENIGMRALMSAQGVSGAELEPYHIGFILGPCINATGRLATADNAYELLACEDIDEAERLAGMLVAMNDERKDMTEKGVKKAIQMADSSPYLSDRVLVIYLKDTHESVAGIIAGKVREHSGKPSFVLTDGESSIKGSGRSIEEYDMYSSMTEVSELFANFGGHKMAAGLSLAENITPEMFRERINDTCHLTEKDLYTKICFDMQLPFSYVTMELAKELLKLGPCGIGNSKPLFAVKDAEIQDAKIVGKNENMLKCNVKDASGSIVPAICFRRGCELSELARGSSRIKLLYSIGINEYKGNSGVQIIIEHFCR